MNGGNIWWNQIGSSINLLTRLSDVLEAQHSLLLQVPERFPWKRTFDNEIDLRRSAYCSERILKRVLWDGSSDPGTFLMGMDDLCPDRVRMLYWPNQSKAEYLGSQKNIFLNQHYIWVRGIHDQADLTRWLDFVRQYEHAAGDRDNRAVFILETTASANAPLEQIVYRIEPYDCRVFALEAASMLNNTQMKLYQAELANSLSQGCPELCWALLICGKALLSGPVTRAMEISRSQTADDGAPFIPLSEQQARSSAWEASAVLLFPKLERWRMNFVMEHASILSYSLPIHNSNGQRITDPRELETGPLWHIVNNAGPRFSPEEVAQTRLCRDVRNLIAHNQLVTPEQIQAVLDL